MKRTPGKKYRVGERCLSLRQWAAALGVSDRTIHAKIQRLDKFLDPGSDANVLAALKWFVQKVKQ